MQEWVTAFLWVSLCYCVWLWERNRKKKLLGFFLFFLCVYVSISFCVGVCVPKKEKRKGWGKSVPGWVKGVGRGGWCSRACSDVSHRICHIGRGRAPVVSGALTLQPAAVATQQPPSSGLRLCRSLTLSNPSASHNDWTLACSTGWQDTGADVTGCACKLVISISTASFCSAHDAWNAARLRTTGGY